jgi:hypothetical protein
MSDSALKAEYSFAYDYWFTDVDMLEVEVMPIYSVAIPTFVSVIVFGALGTVFGLRTIALPGLLVTSSIIWIVGRLVSRSKRKRLATLSREEFEKKAKVRRHIPWSSITSVRLKGRKLLIKKNGERYAGQIGASARESVSEFMRGKVGVKFVST